MLKKLPLFKLLTFCILFISFSVTALDITVPLGNSIQDAIDDVNASGGGTVTLASGTHTITETLEMKSNVTFQGSGIFASIIKINENKQIMAEDGYSNNRTNAVNNVLIQNVTFIGVNGDEGGVAITQQNTDNENITFLNVRCYNVGWGVHIKGAKNVLVENCDFSQNGAAGKEGFAHNLYLRRVYGAVVKNSSFNYSTSANGINISYSEDVEIYDCEMIGNYFRGVRAADSDGYLVHDCIITDNGNVGLLANTEVVVTKNIDWANNCVANNDVGMETKNGATGTIRNCNSYGNGSNYKLVSSVSQSNNVSDSSIDCGSAIEPTVCESHDAFTQIEAEDFCDDKGIEIASGNVGFVNNSDWIMFSDVDFGSGVNSIEVSASSGNSGGNIELRQGSASGTLLGTLEVENTGSWRKWETFSAEIDSISGVQDLYLVFTGGSGYLLDVDWFQFSSNEPIITVDTNTNTITLQENATGFCEFEGTVDSNHDGYTGTGFANTDNVNGNGIDWKIDGTAGSYAFTWRYASTSNRSAKLVVNGATVANDIEFNASGAWSTWYTESVTVTLSEGIKAIRLEATNGSGLGNIDYMEVTGINVLAAACDVSSVETDCAGVSGGTASVDACGVCSGGTTGVNATSPQRWYADTDGDGTGDSNTFVEDCSQPNGYVLLAGDNCPNDANKNDAGDCGCGVVEGTCSDSDCNNTTAFTEAECYDDEQGVITESSNGDGENLGYLDNGDWARYNAIDLSNVNSFNAMLSTRNSGRSIEMRLDSLNGTLIGTLSVPNTGEWHSYVSRSTSISNVSGTHDIFLVFKGGSFNIGSFGFTEENIVESGDCSGFFEGITVTPENPGCSNNDGQINITFENSAVYTQIQLSIDGGNSYPVTVNDNAGSYSFMGLSNAQYQVAARYVGGDCEFNIAHLILVRDCGSVNLRPNGESWHDSYEANGFCWCSTENYDHNLGSKKVIINGTQYGVRDICEELEFHPAKRERQSGDNLYNDIQCGNGPINDSDDEPLCPGRVDMGAEGCLLIGVRWDMEWLASRDRFGGSSNKDIETVTRVNYTVYPNPVLEGSEVTIASDSNVRTAQLYDMGGRLVKGALLNDNTMIINTTAPGLYLLHILFEDGAIKLKKLVVE